MSDELDSAAQALGAAHAAGAAAPRPAQYEVRCVFCNHMHISDYWDEIESGIMQCREGAPGWRRGELEYYDEGRTIQDCGP